MTNLADMELIHHHQQKNAEIIARLERIPVTRRLQFMRVTIGIAMGCSIVSKAQLAHMPNPDTS